MIQQVKINVLILIVFHLRSYLQKKTVIRLIRLCKKELERKVKRNKFFKLLRAFRIILQMEFFDSEFVCILFTTKKKELIFNILNVL